jgi:Protein of unknown function (DUF2909)
MKVIIAVLMLGIVASLGHALLVMSSGPDHSGRVVRALTVRVALSLVLFIVLIVGWQLGLIEPHGGH